MTNLSPLIGDVQWDDNTAPVMERLNEVVNSANAISSSISKTLGGIVGILSSTLSRTKALRAVRDARRELSRLSLRRYDLDLKRAKLDERSALQTLQTIRQTGARIATKQAVLDLEKARRDIATTEMDIIDKQRKALEDKFDAEKQLEIAQLSFFSSVIGLIVALTSLITVLYANSAKIWAEIMLHLGTRGVVKTVLTFGAYAIAVTAAIVAIELYLASVFSSLIREIPSAQTRGSEVKQVKKEGIVYMHSGEYVYRKPRQMRISIELEDMEQVPHFQRLMHGI